MLEPCRLDGQHQDFSVSKIDYLYPFTDPYCPLLIFVLVGIFGRDGGNRAPPLTVYENPAWMFCLDRLHDVSYLPDHPLRPGQCRPLPGRECLARAHRENHPNKESEG